MKKILSIFQQLLGTEKKRSVNRLLKPLESSGRKYKKAAAIFIAAALFTIGANVVRKPKSASAEVTLLTDDAFLPSIITDIANAKSTVHCAIYMFKTESSEDSSGLIMNALIHAAENNVKVHVLLDLASADDLATQFNTYTGAIMERAGITVVYDSPDRRLHAKICVIDDISYIGSHNYTFSALKRNAEVSVRIQSPEIASETVEYIMNLSN